MQSPEFLLSRRPVPPSVFPAVQTESLESLFAGQVAEKIAPGSAVFWEGDAAAHVFLVVEGCLRVYRTLPDGRRAILGLIYPGDLLGVSSRDRYLFTTEAVSPVKLRRFPRRRFHELVDDAPHLRPMLFAKICDEMTAAQDQMILLGRKTAQERVVSFLLMVARRSGADTRVPVEIELPVGRLDMADFLGLTIETVSREISKLKRAGLIALKGTNHVVLRRMRSLQDLAEGDDGERLPGEMATAARPMWAH
jgi:CRP/FNR family transcriptional regulator